MGKALGLRPRRIDELRNLDQGLWQGLQIEEIKRRNTKLFRQWIEDPRTICPPQGETVADAIDRVKTAFKPLVRRHQDGDSFGLVVGEPLARLISCILKRGSRPQLDEQLALLRIRANRHPAGLAGQWLLLTIQGKNETVSADHEKPARADGNSSRIKRSVRTALFCNEEEGVSPWPREEENRSIPGMGTRNRNGFPKESSMRCDGCSATLFRKQVDQNDKVCPECNHHFPVTAVERINQLLDQDTYEDWFSDLQPADPLQFDDRRPYPERVKAEQERTGLNEAALVGQGFIKGIRIVFGITDSNFIMGSMGSVVGEKLTRAVEAATRQKLPLVIVSGSGGGARMHEGIFSLMQMAKISTALGRYRREGGLFISVLTHPTMGGVAASFASLGDIIVAEPKALIGFAGPRVIEQTVRVQLPQGFQTSEFLLEHGFIDRIVHRRDLRSMIAQLIDYAMP